MRGLMYVFLTVVSVAVWLSPPIAYAEITPTSQVQADCLQVEQNGPCIPTDVGSFVQEYYTWGLGIIGGVAVLFIIFGGYIIMTSRGNPMRLRHGKEYIGYALIGLMLAIFGFMFTEVITVDVLGLPGFNR